MTIQETTFQLMPWEWRWFGAIGGGRRCRSDVRSRPL